MTVIYSSVSEFLSEMQQMLSNTVRKPNILVKPTRWDSGATLNVSGPRGSTKR